jgi:hypothetical protein
MPWCTPFPCSRHGERARARAREEGGREGGRERGRAGGMRARARTSASCRHSERGGPLLVGGCRGYFIVLSVLDRTLRCRVVLRRAAVLAGAQGMGLSGAELVPRVLVANCAFVHSVPRVLQGGTIAAPGAPVVPPAAGVHGAATAGCGCASVRRAALAVEDDTGSNACTSWKYSPMRIESAAACLDAAYFFELRTDSTFTQNDPTQPKGCYYSFPPIIAHFNGHSVGAGKLRSRLLCAAEYTGAPTRGTEGTPSRRRMRVFVCSRAA